jgi:hypothetical protein
MAKLLEERLDENKTELLKSIDQIQDVMRER